MRLLPSGSGWFARQALLQDRGLLQDRRVDLDVAKAGAAPQALTGILSLITACKAVERFCTTLDALQAASRLPGKY